MVQTLLSSRFFKKASGILQSPASVSPSVSPTHYLLLNHWTKSNQIWCVSCSHECGAQRHISFWSRPLGPLGGAKRSNIIKFQFQSQFQRFLNQTFCVFLPMKDIKHIRRDFHFTVEVMPQGWVLGYHGGGVKKKSKIQAVLVCELLSCMPHAAAPFFGSLPPGALGRGQKVKYH